MIGNNHYKTDYQSTFAEFCREERSPVGKSKINSLQSDGIKGLQDPSLSFPKDSVSSSSFRPGGTDDITQKNKPKVDYNKQSVFVSVGRYDFVDPENHRAQVDGVASSSPGDKSSFRPLDSMTSAMHRDIGLRRDLNAVYDRPDYVNGKMKSAYMETHMKTSKYRYSLDDPLSKSTTKALLTGTNKAAGKLPGYTGHVPAASLTTTKNLERNPLQAKELVTNFTGHLPGYTGFIPKGNN